MHVRNLGLLVRGLSRIQGHNWLGRSYLRDLSTRSGLTNRGQYTASRMAEFTSCKSAGPIGRPAFPSRIRASTRDRAYDQDD